MQIRYPHNIKNHPVRRANYIRCPIRLPALENRLAVVHHIVQQGLLCDAGTQQLESSWRTAGFFSNDYYVADGQNCVPSSSPSQTIQTPNQFAMDLHGVPNLSKCPPFDLAFLPSPRTVAFRVSRPPTRSPKQHMRWRSARAVAWWESRLLIGPPGLGRTVGLGRREGLHLHP